MNATRFLAVCLVAAVCGQLAHAQMAPVDARSEGEAIATGVRDATNSDILTDGAAAAVPGYQGTDFPSYNYVDDPEGLTAAGEAQRYQDSYRVVANPFRTTFDPATIDLSSARAIESDPDLYIGPSTLIAGGAGTCNPLPAGGGGASTYLESCNAGSRPYDEARTCSASLSIQTEGSRYWEYNCFTDEPQPGHTGVCGTIASALQAGSCTLIDRDRVGLSCLQWVYPDRGGRPWCAEPGEPLYRETWSCPNELPVSFRGFERNTARIVSESVDDTACNETQGTATCTLVSEQCTAPSETRTIGGLAVTRPCWEWSRTYRCEGLAPANDCGALQARADCSFSHDECLSYNDEAETVCNVHDRWYQCTLTDNGAAPPPAYVCAGDLYCIDGECTQVEREASTEFKDAMVAMNVMGELRDNFDPGRLKIFSGENLKCTRKVFGLSNCCSGKGVPLLTPFLCSREDRDVDERDDAGLCHYAGTYCSDRVLGVCVTRKQSYCCYGSKLVRVLNEQGKAQLGMLWGTAKDPDCEGFLITQFQQLDLSRMDFREIYAEFVDAAKLPEEIALSIQIQEKIENYYNLHGGT